MFLSAITLGKINRNHYGAANNAHEDEDIAAHLGETQEDGGIEPDTLDQLGFFGAQDRSEPGEKALAHWWWGVFVVCMFDLGGVND